MVDLSRRRAECAHVILSDSAGEEQVTNPASSPASSQRNVPEKSGESGWI